VAIGAAVVYVLWIAGLPMGKLMLEDWTMLVERDQF